MIPSQSQNCPLCASPAEYELVDHKNYKHFLCANCTEFQISARVEPRIAKSPSEWKADLAQMAKTHPEDSTLVVRLPNAPRKEGVAYEALSAKYVKNSDLPR